MKVLNLTQHPSTLEQSADGVISPSTEDKAIIKELLTFTALPTSVEMTERARKLVHIASRFEVDAIMIAGAPYFMSYLEHEFGEVGTPTVYSFSLRESVERVVDGNVVKTSVFKHIGWV